MLLDLEPNGEMTQVAPLLYQGSRPLCGTDFRAATPRIDALVLCAQEYQPGAECFPGIQVLHVKLDDSGIPPTDAELRDARKMGGEVARRLARGQRVLVTCFMGLNRSGIVSAVALHELYGMSGADAIRRVQLARPNALGNRYFKTFLKGLPRKGGLTFSPDAFKRDPSLPERVRRFSASLSSSRHP